MNPYTLFKFDFTFEVWILVPAPDGVTYSQTFYRNANGLLLPGAAQTYMFTKEQIPYGTVIKAVKDPSGNPVFEEFGQDIDRYIIASEPTFDVYGNLNGYRQTVSRSMPIQYRGAAV